jgi:RHS repeat-associated protein
MIMPDRNGTQNNGDEYRYGFNGMEKDDEIKGKKNSYDFGARLYDPRVGRWLSIDPLARKFTDLSPYNFVNNMPIIAVDIDGRDIGIVVTSMAKKPGGSREMGHMAIIVGNDVDGWWIFSVENIKNLDTYVAKDEIIFEAGIVNWQAKLSGNEGVAFYNHREDTKECLIEYMSENAPGVDNPEENMGFGYDRMAILKGTDEGTTGDLEKAFIEYLQSQTGEDWKYGALTENCASVSIDRINEFIVGAITDKTFADFPNKEFDKIAKDPDWVVVYDNKEANDAQRDEIIERIKNEEKTEKKAAEVKDIETTESRPKF